MSQYVNPNHPVGVLYPQPQTAGGPSSGGLRYAVRSMAGANAGSNSKTFSTARPGMASGDILSVPLPSLTPEEADPLFHDLVARERKRIGLALREAFAR